MINEMRELLSDLENAQANLVRLEHGRSLLDFKGHQCSAAVEIGGIKLEVTTLPAYGATSIKRGFEMIHLGMQKVFNARIDSCKEEIKAIENKIAQHGSTFTGDNQ